MREKALVIGGYLFGTKKDYNEAKEEQESINFLRSKTDLSNPRTALKLYNKLIEKRTFHTVIGYTFLKELQGTILNAGIVKEEDLDAIYIPAQDSSDINLQSLENDRHLNEKLKIRIRNAGIVNLFLLITIFSMIIIAIYTDKTMYTSFENKMIDRYSAWEDELNNREQDLIQREKAVDDPVMFE